MTGRSERPSASHVYCLYLDTPFLARGIVTLRSLRRHDPAAALVALALDELSARILRDRFRGELQVIETPALHAADPALAGVRGQRSQWAYYMTLTPPLARFALESLPQSQAVIFIDADLCFFGDPSPVFEEIAAASIAISPHRFHAENRGLAKYGWYNAGCIYWRNDETGRRSIADWREDCLAWCSEEPQSDGRFMNQGYLNRWPERYRGVHVVRHPGWNLAPWNVDGHALEQRQGAVLVDGRPLIFYHFSGLNRDAEGQWYSFYPHLSRQLTLARDAIYHPYIQAVEAESRALQQACGNAAVGTVRSLAQFPPAVRFHPPGLDADRTTIS